MATASSAQTAPPSNVLRRISRAAYARSDLLVAALLLIYVVHYYAAQHFPIPLNALDYFDESWQLDLVAKAQQGIWLGRDAVFTYGPLFQWIISRGPLAAGATIGSFYIALWIFQYFSIILLLYGTVALLLRREAASAWKRAFLLALLVVFWAPVSISLLDVKILFPLCCFSLFLRFAEDGPPGLGAQSLRAILAAGLIAIAFLLSSDSGVYALAAFFAVLIAFSIFRANSQNRRSLAIWCGMAGLFFLILILTTNAAIAAPFDFRFWRASLEVLSTYRWAQPVPATSAIALRFWGVIVACTLTLLLVAMRAGRDEVTHLRARILAMFLFSATVLESCIVSSEKQHVALGTFPLIVFAASSLLAGKRIFPARMQRVAPLLLLLAVTAAVTGPNHLFTPGAVAQSFASRPSGCPAGRSEYQQVCLAEADRSNLEWVARYLDANSAPQDSVIAFPYQNIYGFVAERRVAGAVIQNYMAAGERLTSLHLAALAQQRPRLAVYAADKLQSVAVDGVPNFTRNPEVWFYLQRWYRTQEMVRPGLLILQRDEQRGENMELRTAALPATLETQRVKADEEISLLRLPAAAALQADFLKLRMTVKYPFYWRLLKPAWTTLVIHYAEGSQKIVPAVLEPNRAYDVWLFAGDDRALGDFFAANEANWRAAHAAVTGIGIRFRRADWASVAPSAVAVEAAQSVSPSLR